MNRFLRTLSMAPQCQHKLSLTATISVLPELAPIECLRDSLVSGHNSRFFLQIT